MSLSDIDRREYVLQAMAECDLLGRAVFNAKYGYHQAVRYVLVFEGRQYDSKAILGVAHQFIGPGAKPLPPSAFSGGLGTVVKRLSELDFEVIELDTDGVTSIHSEPGSAVPIVLVENETTYDAKYDDWDDVTGVRYHFPNQYKNRIVPGRRFVYYRGVRRADNKRGPAEYFGVGQIGKKWADPRNDPGGNKRKWAWYCEIVNYVPFAQPVPATDAKGARFEDIDKENSLAWRTGARWLSSDAFDAILTEAGVDPQAGLLWETENELVGQLSLPPIDSLFIKSVAPGKSILKRPPKATKPPGSSKKDGTTQPSTGTRYSAYSKLVGDRAEEIAWRWLKDTLPSAESTTLDHVAAKFQFPGWDIEYTTHAGVRIAVEVKGTSGTGMVSLEMTANEWEAAKRERAKYKLLLVSETLAGKPEVDVIDDPAGLLESGDLIVQPSTWRISRSPG